MAAAECKRTAGGDHLPPEIWREVLAGLPAKSILRCRSVCKSWYSLVSCPSFISYYETLNKNRNNRLLLQHSDIGSVSFTSFDESFMESREHDDFLMTSTDTFGGFQFIGSCNGLICLSKYAREFVGFLVWNPTIRKTVELPSRINAQFPSYVGFGFDSNTNDFKVMCAMDDVCEIFDSSKGVWRTVSPLMPPCRVGFGFTSQDCYLNGSVHWTNRSDTILLSFNMSDECFRDIKMPALCGSSIIIRTVTFRGLINVIAWNTRWSCSVWVMKEYGVAESWTKVSNITLTMNRIEPQVSPALLWGNGEVLMVNEPDFGSRKHLVLYNSKRKRFEEVSRTIDKHVANMCLYRESLVLMRGNEHIVT